MAKSTYNAGKTNAGKAKMRTAARPTARTRTTTRTAAKRTTPATSTRGQRSLLGAPRARTSAGEQPAGSGAQRNAPSRLRPITQRQSRDQILATIATDSGVDRSLVERVARSLSQTVQRHLMRNGSGRVDIPYLGAALWRGRDGARKARKMASPILKGRIVEIPARKAMAVARIRVHSALREIVARA